MRQEQAGRAGRREGVEGTRRRCRTVLGVMGNVEFLVTAVAFATGSGLGFKKILLAAEQSLELRSSRSRSLESSEEPAVKKAERMVAGDEDFPGP